MCDLESGPGLFRINNLTKHLSSRYVAYQTWLWRRSGMFERQIGGGDKVLVIYFEASLSV